jgi:formate/nitrite transporter FocA (FNT family)
MTDTDRTRLGNSEGPHEDELEQAFNRLIEEGVQRLHRPWREVLITGFFGGTEVAVGVLAFVAVREATGSALLAGLAFSVGFLALLLGRSELFTEGFLVPVTTLAAKRATAGQLAKLWGGTLAANLLGGWLIMWLVMKAYPGLNHEIVESAAHFALAPFSLKSVCLAVLGGAVITLMTRWQHGTDSTMGKITASVACAFLLAGLQMFHSVLDSLLIFGALHTGAAPFGYLDWLSWFAYTAVGNAVGGLLLVTLLRVVRTKDRVEEERAQVHHQSVRLGR